ncbi:MAG: hypothetical protein K2F96_08775, partial [Muribaculaceae bacterium]|nr:hypothetical protein [Muribaculaceae bacterium]
HSPPPPPRRRVFFCTLNLAFEMLRSLGGAVMCIRESCGLKGRRFGGAMVWESQPLVIVNASGTATSADVVGLENEIIRTVRDRFNITLVPEVEHV